MADAEAKEEAQAPEEPETKTEPEKEGEKAKAESAAEESKAGGEEVSVVVPPQSKKEITINVEEGQVLSWSFTVEGSKMALGMDIGFCVKKRMRSEVDGKEVVTDWELPWNGFGKLGGSVSSFFASNRDVVRYVAGSPVEGVWGPAVQACEVVLVFNNSYSRFMPKTIKYSAKADTVEDGFGEPEEPLDGVERSYIMIKPDGVQRGCIGEIVSRFEQKGFKLVGMRMISSDKDLLSKHYADLSEKNFFNDLVEFMSSAPVVAMVWEGNGVVAEGRKMLGATHPKESLMGTIRGDYCIDIGRNICHGSDSPESAKKEIALWFTETEICDYLHVSTDWINE